MERHDGVETVAEFRAEQFFDGGHAARGAILLDSSLEPDGVAAHFPRAGVGGHEQDDVTKIRLAAVVVGQSRVVHDLEQDGEHVHVGFLDLVQQEHAVRSLADGVGQKAALLEADIAGRRADEAGHGVLFHVLAHVEADKGHAQAGRQLLGQLGLAHTRGTGQQKRAHRPLGIAQPGSGALDGLGQNFHGLLLAENLPSQILLQPGQTVPVRGGHAGRGNTGHAGHDFLDVLAGDGLTPAFFSGQDENGPGLVDDVDGLVRQAAVVQMPGRQLHCGGNGRRLVFHAMEGFVMGLEAHQDLLALGQRGLDNVDLLKAPRQGAILLEMILVFLVGRGADAAQLARSQHGLQDVRGVHGPAAGRARADNGVDLVDAQDGAGNGLEFGDDALEPGLEITPVFGPGQKAAHVQGEDTGLDELLRDLAARDPQGQALGHGRLAHAGVADKNRVVLFAPGQNLQGALEFFLAPDQGIDLARFGPGHQIDGVFFQHASLGPVLGLALLGPPALGQLVRDVFKHAQPGQALGLQIVDGEGVFLLQHGGQEIPGLDLGLAGGLDVQDGPLHGPLHADRLHDLVLRPGADLEMVHEKLHQLLAQPIQVNAAPLQDGLPVGVQGITVEQMLQGQELVLPQLHFPHRVTNDSFQILAQHSHLFHRTAQGKGSLASHLAHQLHLGLGYLRGIDPAQANALLVHAHHHAKGFILGLVEDRHQHLDHEIHGRVVVVMQQHLELPWLPQFVLDGDIRVQPRIHERFAHSTSLS